MTEGKREEDVEYNLDVIAVMKKARQIIDRGNEAKGCSVGSVINAIEMDDREPRNHRSYA